MTSQSTNVRCLQVGRLKLEIYLSAQAAGLAAANATAESLRALSHQPNDIGVIFATGVSQLLMLEKLTSQPNMPWDRVVGFHLDEYVALPIDHRASFRSYLRKHLLGRVHLKEFHEINGTAADLDKACRDYSEQLRASDPHICLLGVGENGHLAFNDPGEADFADPKDIKVVQLDAVCREQQLQEGWFSTLDEVPRKALTLTIPTILRVPKLVVSVPGRRKAAIVRQMLEAPVSSSCPATILRNHPDATVYLDTESSSELADW